MKKLLSIASTLLLGFAFTLAACGKDKKDAAKAKNEPTAAEPAKPDPAAAEAKPEAKPEEKKAGGW